MTHASYRTALALLALLALLAVGCGDKPTASVPPAPSVATWHDGMNDGFHGPLPPDVAAAYAQLGGDVTIRTPHLTLDSYISFADSVADAPNVHALALVEAPDVALATALSRLDPAPRAIEGGNELELAPWTLTPSAYADWIGRFAEATRGYTGDVLMGGVYALTTDTQQAILLALPRCQAVHPDCVVSVHLYDPSDADLDWLNTLPADIAVTETGSPTGCGTSRWSAQADYIAGLRARFAARIRRLRYVVVYQRPSGSPTDCSDLATFGAWGWTLDPASGAWMLVPKPLWQAFAGWVQR